MFRKANLGVRKSMRKLFIVLLLMSVACHQEKKAPQSKALDLDQYSVLAEGTFIDDKGQSSFVKFTMQDRDDELLPMQDYFVYGKRAVRLIPTSILEDKQLIPQVRRTLQMRMQMAEWFVQFFERMEDLSNELKILKAQKTQGNQAIDAAITQKESRILELFKREQSFMSGYQEGEANLRASSRKDQASSIDFEKTEMLITKVLQYAKDKPIMTATDQAEIEEQSNRFALALASFQSPIVFHPK